MTNNDSNNDENLSEKSKKTPNLLDSLKIDEGIEKIREKLNEMKLLQPLDDFMLTISDPGIQLALKLMFQFEVKGKENFPSKDTPAVIVMNHQTDLDPFFLNLAVNQKVRWFVKEKNVNIPIVKSLVPAFGLIVMKEGMDEMEAAGQIIKMLNEGQKVGMFPEGKPTTDGTLHPFHRFPVRFCIQLKVPYVPVAIVGGIDAFPPKSKPWEAKVGKKIEIRIGKPVMLDPKLKSTPQVALEVAQQMQKQIQALMDE